jgi:hypothetical protein
MVIPNFKRTIRPNADSGYVSCSEDGRHELFHLPAPAPDSASGKGGKVR